MKIIDLLNKIAKGEMIGTKFEYENDYFMVGDSGQINRYTNESFKEIEYPYDNLGSDYDSLNDEIEIIEEIEDKEYENIEELDVEYDYDGRIDGVFMARPEVEERKLINALIRNQKKIIERLDK